MSQRALPRTTSSMPSVTRNDGIPSRVTKTPFTKPMQSATPIAIRNAGNSDMVPALNSAHITTGAKPKTEPTERSNSPEVISRVMASAIRPSSTVKVSALLTLVSDMNAGLMAVKTTSISTRSASGPNSGIATKSRTKPGVSGGATCGAALSLVAHADALPDLKPPPAKDRGRRRRSVSCRP